MFKLYVAMIRLVISINAHSTHAMKPKRFYAWEQAQLRKIEAFEVRVDRELQAHSWHQSRYHCVHGTLVTTLIDINQALFDKVQARQAA